MVIASMSGTGPGIGREAAQQLARRELARSMYQPSPWTRIQDWVAEHLHRLFVNINLTVPGGWWALICLAIAVIVVAAVVMARIRPAANRRVSGAIQIGAVLSARDHRELAERNANSGDYSAALIEMVRAITAELEERDFLPVRPGRTADELAVEAGNALPAQAPELTTVAGLFDDVMYGGHTGTADAYRQAQALDVGVRATKASQVEQAQPAPAGAML
jgi:hypothetical protein